MQYYCEYNNDGNNNDAYSENSNNEIYQKSKNRETNLKTKTPNEKIIIVIIKLNCESKP